MRNTTDAARQSPALAAALALAIALSAAAAVFAQTTGEPAQSAAQGDTTSSDADDRSDAGGEDTGDGGDAENSGDGVVLSPFDYEASESISEDASVSFPVDI